MAGGTRRPVPLARTHPAAPLSGVGEAAAWPGAAAPSAGLLAERRAVR